MNTILQQRIEEAARDFNRKEGIPYALTGHVFNAFIEGAIFVLQNQWISVDEALPEDKTKVFVIVKTPVGIVHRAGYHINDYWYMNRYSPEEIVTHWMSIQSLKGGEE